MSGGYEGLNRRSDRSVELVGQCLSCWKDGAACSARKRALLTTAATHHEQRLKGRMLRLLQQQAAVQVGPLIAYQVQLKALHMKAAQALMGCHVPVATSEPVLIILVLLAFCFCACIWHPVCHMSASSPHGRGL